MIGEVICQLVVRTLAQFKNTFAKHSSAHQFTETTSSECETMVHGVKIMLDLHLGMGGIIGGCSKHI